MNNLIQQAAAAKLILVPKGDDSRPCLQAFEDATGIKVPEFKDRVLEVEAGGRTFFKVKGRDIPRFIAAGYGDMGLTGSDSCEDYMATDDSVAYQSFGPRMCRFVLLAPAARVTAVRRQLQSGGRRLEVATSFPELLRLYAAKRKLNIEPSSLPICGSVEIMPRLLGVPLVADLVSTGTTAKSNGLVEVQTLMNIYPVVVVRAGSASERPEDIAPGDIDRIDLTLAARRKQLKNKAKQSYTLDLMRDTNKAGKKAGEEFSEVMMALSGPDGITELENEIADLTYAQLVAAYSRGKAPKLANVVRIMIERNRRGERL